VLVRRGFVILLFMGAAGAIILFTHIFARFFQQGSNTGMGLSVVFGILVWASAPVVKRGTERIDRAFFSSAYDAGQVLENLEQKTREASSCDKLAELLEARSTRLFTQHPLLSRKRRAAYPTRQ